MVNAMMTLAQRVGPIQHCYEAIRDEPVQYLHATVVMCYEAIRDERVQCLHATMVMCYILLKTVSKS